MARKNYILACIQTFTIIFRTGIRRFFVKNKKLFDFCFRFTRRALKQIEYI